MRDERKARAGSGDCFIVLRSAFCILFRGVIPVLVPVKTIVNPYNERLPDRQNPRRDRKKRGADPSLPHHLQQEPAGARIDVIA